MSYNIQQNLVGKYVWLIETIYRAKKITFKEINERWKDNVEMSGGEKIPLRTFNNWRYAIQDMFGLFIENERCGSYRYYIDNEEDISNNGLRSWIYSTYCVGNALAGSQSIKSRILLEDVPSGQVYLHVIIEAMKENRVLNITYHSYWKDEEYNFDVEPFCVKLFKQRWYMVGLSTDEYFRKQGPKIYSLDRIHYLCKTDETFTMPEDWNGEDFFAGCFGIIADQRIPYQTVKLKVTESQANYIRDLQLHESQQEIERNDEYSIFTYYLRPQYDFIQEILSNGEDMEVLEPHSLREEIAGMIKRMNNYYQED